jgi:tol-pal system protein YbgF
MRSVVARPLIAGAVALALAGCNQVKPDDPIVARIDGLDARIAQIERVLSNQSLLEVANQLQDAQAELRALRGEVEGVSHEVEGQKKRARDLYGDIDERLKAVEQGVQNAATGAAAASAEADRTAYEGAFELLKQSRYDQARAAFASFLAKYPQSPLRANAQLWLAETHYVTKNFKASVTEFKKVIDGYPDSDKVADAYLKLGYSQYELQNWDEARKALSAVSQRFPDTSAAKLAVQRLKKMSDEGR